MNRPMSVALALAAVALVAACSSAPASSGAASPAAASAGGSTSASQTEEAGGVTLTATWEDPGKALTFHVKLDNHTIDLDGITLAGATLRNDRGDTLMPEPWTAPSGSHHRDGWLKFDGDPVTFLAGARWIELTLPPIGSVTEPPLRWAVGNSS